MRRPIVVLATSIALAAPLTAGSPGVADSPTAERASVGTPTDTAAQALAAARAALGVDEPARARRTSSARPDATLALRDLFRALPGLDPAGRRTAQGLLARPTDGAADRLGDGYTVPAEKKCRSHLCLHWVTSTADAPPSQDWVDTNLAFMNKVWRTEVKEMGYRAPISDRRRGGDSKFDVYLKELGSRGLYGYCVPERQAPNRKWLASGYCVLDNDFAEAQYNAPPRASLRVTGAHEFFHAVQFAYDYGEDPWLMEATATWMEERIADNVNDNRQYLPYGQLGAPAQPLDLYDQQRFNQYGNWLFFEHLSHRFGNGIVRSIWTKAGAYPGSGRRYSTAAVTTVLSKRGGFPSVYRSFASANITPARSYPEGEGWSAPSPAKTWSLTKADPRGAATLEVNHMAARNVVVRPDGALAGKRWQLKIAVDGPATKTDPEVGLVVRTKRGVDRRTVRLDDRGRGTATLSLPKVRVKSVTVVLVNASTRFSCWHRTDWSCQGRARDNKAKFDLHAVVRRAER